MDYAVRITLSASSPVPAYTGGFWAAGVASLSASAVVAGWTPGKLIACGSVGEKVDIAQGGNYAMLDDVDVTITAVGWTDFVAAGASIRNATIEIGTLFAGVLTPRWVGYVLDAPWQGAEILITAESLAGRRHKEVPARTLTSGEIPNLPSASEGAAVPIVWGSVERMTPPKYSQDRQYLDAFYRVESGVIVDTLTSAFIQGTPSGANIIVGVYGRSDSTPLTTVPATYWAALATSSGKTAYIEISSGTGAGQTRARVSSGSFSSVNDLGTLPVVLDSAFSPQPDATSILRFFVNSDYVSLAISDECSGIAAAGDESEREFPLVSTSASINGIEVASISAEFIVSGEYAATKYMKPSSDYGVSLLSDGVTQTGSVQFLAQATTRTVDGFGISFLFADIFCLAKFDADKIPKAQESDKMFFMYSAEGYNLGSGKGQIVLHGIAANYDHTVETAINYERTGAYGPINSYSPGTASDGDFGNFALHAKQLTGNATISGRAKALYLCACTEKDTGIGGSDLALWCRADDGAIPSGATTFVASWNATAGQGYFPLGEFIQPVLLGDPGESEWQNSRCTYGDCDASGSPEKFIGTRHAEWREIIGVNLLSSFTDGGNSWGRVQYTIATPFSDTYGACRIVRKTATFSHTVAAKEKESGLAISYGQFTPASQFLASVESGRKYSSAWPSLPSGKSIGDPITTADHAALDLLYRDLGQGSGDVDQTAYVGIADRDIHALVPSRESSADVLARMCREFNWIAAHDSNGKETVRSWLASVGTTSYAYEVTNAHILADSIMGPEFTAIEDIITLPTISRSWTQADGFRKVASIVSLAIDPDDLTESNYQQYATGFDSYAQAAEAYTALYASRAAAGVEQRGDVSYQYSSDIQTLLIDSGLLDWIAARKEILTFAVTDEHAAAWAVVGDRFKVTHKRYAVSAKYGTLIARYWMPGKATESGKNRVQLTVMIDP